jgi:hypothetical protein
MSSNTIRGPIDMTRKRDDLRDIAKRLGIAHGGNKAALIANINDYINSHPEIAFNPELQNLVQYRPSSGGAKKTSAQKAAEDLLQKDEGLASATG